MHMPPGDFVWKQSCDENKASVSLRAFQIFFSTIVIAGDSIYFSEYDFDNSMAVIHTDIYSLNRDIFYRVITVNNSFEGKNYTSLILTRITSQ